MRKSDHLLAAVGIGALFGLSSPTLGSFQGFSSLSTWQSATGTWTTLDFVFTQNVLLDEQYESLGVLFPGDGDIAGYLGPSFTPSGDGWGLVTLGEPSIVQFLQPQNAFAVQLGGSVNLKFYAGEKLLLTTLGLSTFTGFTSTIAFDRVELWNPGGIGVDNIYFSAVPAPATLSVFVAAALGRGRRRSA
jgi:hypothetical protein